MSITLLRTKYKRKFFLVDRKNNNNH